MNNPAALRIFVCIIVTALVSFAVISGMNLPLVGVDDANILFVYSKHLAEGHGLVYNIGSERVEGYSSVLWMLITAAGYWLSDQPAALFFALNILLIGASLAFGWRVLDRLTTRDKASAVMPSFAVLIWLAWIIANPDYFIWTTTSLMETGLWSALLLTTVFMLLRLIDQASIDRRTLLLFASLNALLVLTRPESMAWILYFLAMLIITLRAKGQTWRSTLQHWLPVAGGTLLCLLLLIMFRLNYFGFPLPNTYYAKMAPDRLYEIGWGLIYLRDFAIANPLAAACILVALFEFVRLLPAILRTVFVSSDRLPNDVLPRFCVASAALAGIVIPVLMGGDIFGAFRFFQPIWPVLILPAILAFKPAWINRIRPAQCTAACAIALCVFTLAQSNRWTNLSEDKQRVAHLYELTLRGMQTGAYVQEIFPSADPAELPSIGASAAGGYKMGYPGNVIDTMGLNFTPMAHHSGDKRGTRGHASFNKQVFWQHATDLLEPTLCPDRGEPVNRYKDPGNWIFQIYREIFVDQRFIDNYRFIAIQAPESGGWLCTYIKRDLARELEASGKYAFKAVLD